MSLNLSFRIVERAYALRDAREEERRKYVQEKYDDQWRGACDGVRTMDSKALTLHMVVTLLLLFDLYNFA
jgi:hypothetical protein